MMLQQIIENVTIYDLVGLMLHYMLCDVAIYVLRCCNSNFWMLQLFRVADVVFRGAKFDFIY